MVVPGESFPYKQLTAEDKSKVLAMCGGPPVRDREYFRNFLKISGQPALASPYMMTLFSDLAWETLEAFGHDDQRAVRHFNRGLLFYAGVAAEIGGVKPIPYNPTAIRSIIGANACNRAIEGMQRLSEVRGFGELMAGMRPVMENAHDDHLYGLSVMGAGLAHLVSTRTIEQIYHDAESSLALYEVDPDMTELADLFDRKFKDD